MNNLTGRTSDKETMTVEQKEVGAGKKKSQYSEREKKVENPGQINPARACSMLLQISLNVPSNPQGSIHCKNVSALHIPNDRFFNDRQTFKADNAFVNCF
jgi:hypothetical protein